MRWFVRRARKSRLARDLLSGESKVHLPPGVTGFRNGSFCGSSCGSAAQEVVKPAAHPRHRAVLRREVRVPAVLLRASGAGLTRSPVGRGRA